MDNSNYGRSKALSHSSDKKRRTRDRSRSDSDDYYDDDDSSLSDRDRRDYHRSSRNRSRSRSPRYRSRHERQPPTSTVMVNGLPTTITEREFRDVLEDERLNYAAFRLIRDRKTGHSKGFAFVDFYAVEDAQDWIGDTRGRMSFLGHSCDLRYATPKEDDEEGGRDSQFWRSEQPQSTIMLRGLPPMINEIEIRNMLDLLCAKYLDVRVIVNRRTGQSKGFGFVDFDSIQSAKEWMEVQQGMLRLNGQEIRLMYSAPRSTFMDGGDRPHAGGGGHNTPMSSDWTCARCSTHNFKRRDRCFRCNVQRIQSDLSLSNNTDDGSDQIGQTPCNTLILRNLDALSTEDNIIAAFEQLTSVPVKQCHVMRDDTTHVSKCYALVEFPTVKEAEHILEVNLKDKTNMFEIDGKAVTVNYARNTFKTIMISLEYHKRTMQEHRIEAEAISSSYVMQSSSVSISADATNSANAAAALAQAALQKKHVHHQVAQALVQQMHYGVMGGGGGSTSGASTSSGGGGAISGVGTVIGPQQQPQAQQYQTSDTLLRPFDFATCTSTTYPTPDTSTFTYDTTSGYYYDPVTGLYYDPNSKYFYDGRTQQYVFWDLHKSMYIPAAQLQQQQQAQDSLVAGQPSTAAANDVSSGMVEAPGTEAAAPTVVVASEENNTTSPNSNTEPVPEEPAKLEKEKTKSAKKIAKEMEKWAKAMNKGAEQRRVMKQTVTPGAAGALLPSSSSSQAVLSSSAGAAAAGAAAASTLGVAGNYKPHSRSADTGYAMLEAMSIPTISSVTVSKTNKHHHHHHNNNNNSLVAAQYASDDSNEEDSSSIHPGTDHTTQHHKESATVLVLEDPNVILAREEEKSIDVNRKACLLCSRAFKDLETLQKHRTHSDLHKSNVELLRHRLNLPPPSVNTSQKALVTPVAQQHQPSSSSSSSRSAAPGGGGGVGQKYRDRAKERRDKYGVPSPPRGRRRYNEEGGGDFVTPEIASLPAVAAAAAAAPISVENNVGSRLMQKMGWQAGQGLGRANQGRTTIIEAEIRHVGAGLGSAASKPRPPTSGHENYKEKVKQAMFARFQELE